MTEPPADSEGRGEAFSATDLLATALGTGMLTLMGMRASERSYPLDGATIIVKKHMTMSPPRRTATLEVSVSALAR